MDSNNINPEDFDDINYEEFPLTSDMLNDVINRMLSFIKEYPNLENRIVGQTTINKIFVSTVLVTDSQQPYETGIFSSRYNDGQGVIVEMYSSKEEAAIGHERWVNRFRDINNLPKALKDVNTSIFGSIARNQIFELGS